MEKDMDGRPNRRDFIAATAVTAGALTAGGTTSQAGEIDALGPGFDLQTPLKKNWNEVLGSLVHVDRDVDAKELRNPAVQERHRIYC